VTQPALVFDTTNLSYAVNVNSTSLQTLNLDTNSGTSTAYSISADTTWLTLTPGTGVTADTITATVDATGLVQGTYTATITASATGYPDASVSVSLNVVNTIFQTGFDVDADGFAYMDDPFYGTSQPGYAAGVYNTTVGVTGGGLKVFLGGVNDLDILNMSGGWSRSFTTASATTVTFTLSYRMMTSFSYESNECSQVVLAVDGVLYSTSGANTFLQESCGIDGATPTDTGWVTVSIDVPLTAGTHTMTIGGYINQKTKADESTLFYFDDVFVGAGP
jgi:hypothetical protein